MSWAPAREYRDGKENMLPDQVASGARSAEDLINKLKSGVDPNQQNTGATPAQPGTDTNIQTQNAQPTLTQDDAWEHKYRVLQGKYNAEVPKLVTENRQLLERVTALEAEVKRVSQQQPQPVQSQAGEAAKPPEGKYKAEDYAEYGDEFKVMFEENMSLKNKLSEMETLIRNHFGGAQSSQAAPAAPDGEAEFFRIVSGNVPNWEQINVDPAFFSFLVGNDLHMRLNQARQALDANSVVRIFKAFVDSQPSNQNQQQQAPARTPVQSQISPQQTGQQGVTGRVFTRGEIAKFFDDKIRGGWRGREKEAEAFEREIFQAVQERRVAA